MVTVIAAGGQVYDRTTGTWVGETLGSVGDGVDRSVEASRVKIWHGTDGPVGVQLVTATPGGVANPHVATGKGGGGTGPGSAVVGGGGGTGPGAAAVVAGPVKLKPKMQPTHTQIVVGGSPLVHNPGWSDAGEAEERWGEGELLSPTWFYQWGVSLADAWSSAEAWYRGSPFAGVSPAQQQVNADALGNFFWNPTPALVDGKLPPQEPVDWGR